MKPIPPKEQNCKGSISLKYYEIPRDYIEELKAQLNDSEKESVEQSNFDNLIFDSIRTLIWAQTMHKLLWEGEHQFNDQNNAKYKLLLAFEDEFQGIANQQYDCLQYYAEMVENKDVSRKCFMYLDAIKLLYK